MVSKLMVEKLNIKKFLGAIFACLLWSTAFVGVKIGLKYSSPLSFAGIRFIISGLILLPFSGGLRSYFSLISKNFKTIVTISFFQTFILYSLFYTGMTYVSGALAAIVVGFSPLNSAIIAHFAMKDDRMTWQKTFSIILGIIGIIIISLSREPWSVKGFTEFMGIIILLISSISSALGNVFVAKANKNIPITILVSSQLIIGGCALLILSITLEGLPSFIHPTEYFLSLGWLSMVSAVAFTIWFKLLKKPNIKVSDLNFWKFIIPVLGAMWAWLILPDEKPEIFTIIGMLCVGLSIIAYHYCLKINRSTCSKSLI